MEKSEQLKQKLQNGVAHFTFRKKNGDLREAFGTTNGNIVPKYDVKAVENLITESRDFLVGFGTGTLIKGDDDKLTNALKPFAPKEGTARKMPDNIITFFDIEKQAWRSCAAETLIDIY